MANELSSRWHRLESFLYLFHRFHMPNCAVARLAGTPLESLSFVQTHCWFVGAYAHESHNADLLGQCTMHDDSRLLQLRYNDGPMRSCTIVTTGYR